MNTHREKSTMAPPGKGVGKHENPVPGQTGIKRGRGWEMPSPPKDSNPAPSNLGPSWILPLALLSWILIGFPAALVLRAIGGAL